MKRIILILLFCIIVCLLCACSIFPDRYFEGLETFSPNHSMYGICGGTLPENENMLDKFSYIDGNYYFYSKDDPFFLNPYDKMLLYLSYEEDIYQEAKTYVANYRQCNDENIITTINSYVFYNCFDSFDPTSCYLIAFSDCENTIVFLTLYGGRNSTYDTPSCYIVEHFGEWYDFK